MKRMCVLAGLVCFFCSGALAIDYRGVGNWADPNGWSDEAPPTGAVEVKIRGVDTVLTLNTSTGDWGPAQRMRVYEGATMIVEEGAELLGAGWLRVGATNPGYLEQTGGLVQIDNERLGIGDSAGGDGHHTISGGTLTYVGDRGELIVGARGGQGILTVVGTGAVVRMKDLIVAQNSGASGTVEFQLTTDGVSPIALDDEADIDALGDEVTSALLVGSADGAPDADVLLVDLPEGAAAANTFDTVNGEPAAEGAAVVVKAKLGTYKYMLTYVGGDTANDVVLLYDSFVPAPSIMWISDNKGFGDIEPNTPGDQGWVDLLTQQGYEVIYKNQNEYIDGEQYWRTLDPNKTAELEAVDLIILSRNADSGSYSGVADNEPNLWNGVTTPLISLSAHMSRSNKWGWMNSTGTTYTKDAKINVVDPTSVIFAGVVADANDQVEAYSAQWNMDWVTGATDAGNGKVLATRSSDGLVSVATWEAGQEYYDGGAVAGGPRMLFIAGTGSKNSGSNYAPDGMYNLTADGERMFLHAVAYMLNKNKQIIWVSDNLGYDFEAGRPADQGFIDLLTAPGYTVDYKGQFDPHEPGNDEVPVNPEWTYWRELDPNKIAELNAADLVIIARDCASGCYDDGNEPLEWNSITTPILMQSGHIARTGKWSWLNTGGTARSKDPNAVVIDALHPLYDGVSVAANGQVAVQSDEWNVDWANSTDVGNGTLLAARPDGVVWIATWQAGQEYFEGSGQVAGGPRMLFISGSGGSNPIEDGTNNLTIDGELMFLNAVVYMLGN